VSDISYKELRDNFEYFDTDGDGRLNRKEFGALMSALGATEDGSDPSRGFSSIDANHSGGIDFEEFADWFKDN
jgi:calmodulin